MTTQVAIHDGPELKGGTLQRLLIRVLTFARTRELKRQFRLIDRAMTDLPALHRGELLSLFLKDMAQASKLDAPHFYGTRHTDRYQPWGSATAEAIAHLKGDNLPLRLHGLARWLVVAYHETRESSHAELQELHRQLQRRIRLFKETVRPAEVQQILQRLRPAA